MGTEGSFSCRLLLPSGTGISPVGFVCVGSREAGPVVGPRSNCKSDIDSGREGEFVVKGLGGLETGVNTVVICGALVG